MLGLLAWAVDHWHVVQSRAVTVGLLGPSGAARVLDLPPTIVLALIESILAESEEQAEQIDAEYEAMRPRPAPVKPLRGPERAAQIRAAMAQ